MSDHLSRAEAARITLNGADWQFKGYYGEDWSWRGAHRPGTGDLRHWLKGTVPGSVQHDLWQCGLIPDPYYERNSLAIEWVPERTWVYKKTFTPAKEHQGKRARLHFKGVDYAAQFFLNGELLGVHEGMYRPVAFEVSERLKWGEPNLLAVVIEPAPYEQPQVGRSNRVRTHKSRMTYWWDFCPRMVHLGIWDEVFLEIGGPIWIEDIFVRPQLSPELDQAEVSLSIQLSSTPRTSAEVETGLWLDGSQVASQRTICALPEGVSNLDVVLSLDSLQLWWPNGHGEQPVYEAEVRVLVQQDSASQESDCRRAPFGLRRIEFISNEAADPAARPYTLRVNGKRTYINGWNWVPMDVQYGVERPEKLERLLTLAKRANVNLLRVWGGGLIEKDRFYDLCDRLGILVWQEFIQSSSGIDNNPPDAPEFIDFMVGEAEAIIPRKRNHPSLAIWCGGNELQTGPEQPADERHPLLAALQEAVQRLDPGRYWLPTSPSGPVFSNSLENIARDPRRLHDVHGPWEHQGLEGQAALYNTGASLLHSEFGVEGITNLKTLEAVISKENQWPVSLDNPIWEHLGAWWVKEPRWRQVFGELPDIKSTVRAIQLLQADGLRYAVEADRRRQYHNSGSLPWQFNEPYPMAACTSAVDYFAQPKPAFYAVAGAYAPVRVSAQYPRQAWAGQPEFESEIWVSNSRTEGSEAAILRARLLGASGRCYHHQTGRVALPRDGSAPVMEVRWPLYGLEEDIFFLDLALHEPDGSPLSENRYLFTRAADLAPLFSVPETNLRVRKETDGDRWEIEVANTGESTALFTWLEDGRQVGADGYAFIDSNYFCLFPGESRVVAVDWVGVPPAERRIDLNGWNTDIYRIEE